jgi:hypothetical protein
MCAQDGRAAVKLVVTSFENVMLQVYLGSLCGTCLLLQQQYGFKVEELVEGRRCRNTCCGVSLLPSTFALVSDGKQHRADATFYLCPRFRRQAAPSRCLCPRFRRQVVPSRCRVKFGGLRASHSGLINLESSSDGHRMHVSVQPVCVLSCASPAGNVKRHVVYYLGWVVPRPAKAEVCLQ